MTTIAKDLSFERVQENQRMWEAINWKASNHKFAPYDVVEIIGTQTKSCIGHTFKYDPESGFDYLVFVQEDAVYPYYGKTRWVNERNLRLIEQKKETVRQRIKRRLKTLCQ